MDAPQSGGDNLHAITKVLVDIRQGEPEAKERLMPLVYDQLKLLARKRADKSHTLHPTEIVHEAWMKLAPGLDRINDRKHFFAAAAVSMRHALVDYARAQDRQKRGGGANKVTFNEEMGPFSRTPPDLVVVNECVEELQRINPRHAKVIELRLFGGLTIDETAEELGVSHSTVESDWRMARAWLCKQLSEH